MAAMLGYAAVVAVVAVVSFVVVRRCPRAVPLAMITMRKSIHGFPFLSLVEYGASLGGAAGAPL